MEKKPLGAPLTADEIKSFDEVVFDRTATTQTLKIAIRHASNALNQTAKQEQKLWENILQSRGIPYDNDEQYKIGRHNGTQVILAKSSDD